MDEKLIELVANAIHSSFIKGNEMEDRSPYRMAAIDAIEAVNSYKHTYDTTPLTGSEVLPIAPSQNRLGKDVCPNHPFKYDPACATCYQLLTKTSID